jgi:two-component system response regulator WspF
VSISGTTSPLIAIGSSTGGPKALAAVLSRLPANFNAAIVVVQHVDAQFAPGLVDWLNHQVSLPVRVATVGDRPTKGTVLVASTNDHLHLRADLTLGYIKEPIDYPYRPSVDVFFKSVAQHWNRKGTAVLLTGMGRDGAEGLNTLRFQGWHTIAQDKDSCVVYGMPKAAAELNAAIEILNPEAIAQSLIQRVALSR